MVLPACLQIAVLVPMFNKQQGPQLAKIVIQMAVAVHNLEKKTAESAKFWANWLVIS